MEVILGSSAAFAAAPSFAVSNSRRNPSPFSSEVLLLNHFPARESGGRLCWCLKSKVRNTAICFSSQSPDRSNGYKNVLQSLWWLDKRFVLHCSFFMLKIGRTPRLRKFSISLRKALKRAERFNNFVPAFSLHLIVGVMLVMTLGATVTKTPSLALSEENLLFLEAWRAIDRAYVDKTFNGQSWFRYRENALREEPMNSREETYAAIRKMVATLGDPFTRFLEPKKFKSLRAVRNTEYSYWSRPIYRIP